MNRHPGRKVQRGPQCDFATLWQLINFQCLDRRLSCSWVLWNPFLRRVFFLCELSPPNQLLSVLKDVSLWQRSYGTLRNYSCWPLRFPSLHSPNLKGPKHSIKHGSMKECCANFSPKKANIYFRTQQSCHILNCYLLRKCVTTRKSSSHGSALLLGLPICHLGSLLATVPCRHSSHVTAWWHFPERIRNTEVASSAIKNPQRPPREQGG